MITFTSAEDRRALLKIVRLAKSSTNGDRFSVSFGDIVLGHVERGTETIERRSPGKRYVNRRWTRPCWRNSARWTFYRSGACRSRVEAVARLVEDAMRDGGPLHAHRDEIEKLMDAECLKAQKAKG